MTGSVSRETGGGPEWARSVAAWSGWSLDEAQIKDLESYAGWLQIEARPAGLIGPRETDRIWKRHIADSLVFAVGWDRAPSALVDIGTGAGLPGVPLAVLWPECRVTLVERSAQRGDLLMRLTRILRLANTQVLVTEADQLSESEAIVMRAVLRPPEAVRLCGDLLLPGGRAVLGWSTGASLDEVRTWHPDRPWQYTKQTVPSRVLDDSPSVLIMTARG